MSTHFDYSHLSDHYQFKPLIILMIPYVSKSYACVVSPLSFTRLSDNAFEPSAQFACLIEDLSVSS